ncbi:MAG TPA: CAP domain-containing protein [Solirubrobacterales bacterium]
MVRKLPFLLLSALLLALAIAPTPVAAATSLKGNRAVAAPTPAAERAGASEAGPLIAPAGTCPGQGNLAAPAAVQERAMACMVAFARRQAGLGELADEDALARSAEDKSLDVLRCDEFSHSACGREFTYWMEETGYTSAPCWRVGENLAWGAGEYGTVRSIFTAWMRSPGHRVNILGDFEETGLSLQVGTLEGLSGTHVWAQHFGSRC